MAMMFRGVGKPTDQLDIQLAQPSTSDFSGNLGFAPMPAPPAPEPQKMGTGRMIAGYIGDALAQLGGMRGNFAPAMQQHQEMLRRAQQQQAQRQAEREDWLWKQEWELKNKPAGGGSEPDVIQLQRIADDPNQPESVRKAARDRVTSMNDPIVNVSLGGRDFAGPRSLFLGNQGGGGPQISPQSVASQPATGGPGAPHMTIDQMGAFGSMFPKWQQREKVPVLVTSAADMARVPKGTLVISPDGRTGIKQ